MEKQNVSLYITHYDRLLDDACNIDAGACVSLAIQSFSSQFYIIQITE